MWSLACLPLTCRCLAGLHLELRPELRRPCHQEPHQPLLARLLGHQRDLHYCHVRWHRWRLMLGLSHVVAPDLSTRSSLCHSQLVAFYFSFNVLQWDISLELLYAIQRHFPPHICPPFFILFLHSSFFPASSPHPHPAAEELPSPHPAARSRRRNTFFCLYAISFLHSSNSNNFRFCAFDSERSTREIIACESPHVVNQSDSKCAYACMPLNRLLPAAGRRRGDHPV